MIISDCPGCMAGDHEAHVVDWGMRPEGVIDGESCGCQGDCYDRSQKAFDRLFKAIQRTQSEPRDYLARVIDAAEKILDAEKPEHADTAGASFSADYGADLIEDVFARIWTEAYNTGVADAFTSMDYDGGQTPPARACPYKTLNEY